MSADLFEVRASRLPSAFRCPGSVRPATLSIATDGYGARLGRAVHEVMRTLAETGSVAWAETSQAASRHEVEPAEVAMLAGMAQKLWTSIAASFPAALTEVELTAELSPGVHLTGHVDVLSVTGTVARLLDWKSGRKDHDYAQQLRGYAVLALLEDRTLTEATGTIAWIRDGEIENYTMPRAGVAAWIEDLMERVVKWDGTFHPGGHCGYCHRSHECAAANALVRRDVAALTDRPLTSDAGDALAAMTPQEIIELYHKADLVIDYADRVRAAIKTMVAAGGDVVFGGARLTVESETRRKLDVGKAWPVIDALALQGDERAAVFDVSLSRLEKTIAKRAGRGNGAAAIRALAADLDNAGAVTFEERLCLKEKRT